MTQRHRQTAMLERPRKGTDLSNTETLVIVPAGKVHGRGTMAGAAVRRNI
jgi:hypothetical protein